MEPSTSPQHPAHTGGTMSREDVSGATSPTTAVPFGGSSPATPATTGALGAVLATPPRPILVHSGTSSASQVVLGEKGRNRLLELREPERSRAAGRERTNVLPLGSPASPSYSPLPVGTSDTGRFRPPMGVVTFEGVLLDSPEAGGKAQGESSAAHGTAQHPSYHHPSTPGSSSGHTHYPRFAEQFSTPLRRRPRAGSATGPSALAHDSPADATAARAPTPPKDDSADDLYRGPLPPPEQHTRRTFRFDTSGRQLDEDAVSLRSMSTGDSSSTHSSSSSSSRASVVSFVVGAFEAVGRGLGVLSSASSGSSSSSSSSSSSDGGHRRWHRKRSRRRSSVSTIRGSSKADLEAGAGQAVRRKNKQSNRRKKKAKQRLRRLKRLRAFSFSGSAAMSRRSSVSSSASSGSSSSGSSSSSRSSSSSSSSDDEPLGRRKVVGVREFRLMLPEGPEEDKPRPTYLSPPAKIPLAELALSQDHPGLIRTTELDEVIMSINRLRSAEFYVPTPPPPQAHSEPVPPLTAAAPQPQTALTHSIQIPPTAYDTSRPLTPSQILNIPVPPRPASLDLAQRVPPPQPSATAFQPSAIPSRLLPQATIRTPDPSPPGSRASSLRQELRPSSQRPPAVRIDGPAPLPSPGEKSEHAASLAFKSPQEEAVKPKGAWWLDVSCPTWEDMRALGELLSLHPLTLEDILQQDPREKLEVFPTLDYYLVSFRALDESYFRYSEDGGEGTAADVLSSRGRRKGRGKVEIVEDRPGKEGLEGVGVGGINLYIVVMRDGIVSFHFEDVKKHVAAVTQRVQALERGFPLSSDWIAHMFMDSMVDVFMPLIDFIEDEADAIDSQIVHHDAYNESPLAALADAEDAFVEEERRRLSREEDERAREEAAAAAAAEADGSSGSSDDYIRKLKEAGLEAHELGDRRRSSVPGGGTSTPPRPTPYISGGTTLAEWFRGRPRMPKGNKGSFIVFRRLILALYPLIARTLIVLSLHPAQREARRRRREAKRGPKIEVHDFDRKAMLKRMVGMRRLVTGLNRLLVPKMEVIGRLRKRAADLHSSARLGEDMGEQMSTYFGDIQDHILSMQQTLAYCEHVLSQSQGAYQSQLRIGLASLKNSSQSSIVALSVISIGILPLQIIIGINSTNVTMPKNHGREDDGSWDGRPMPKNLFGIIISVLFVFGCGFILLVRYWRRQAKVKYQKMRENFG